MFLTIIIAFISLITLLIIHELGHFLLAKKFGVKVEEFGLGYPPRIFGKKVGETIYSINLIPFGAFVRMLGEEENVEHFRSFSTKKIWQRALIVFGGVASFWLIAAILLSFVMAMGAPTAVSDDENGDLINPKVQIVAVSPDSPAAEVGIKPGDAIKYLKFEDEQLVVGKVIEVQDFTEQYAGKEISLFIERGKEELRLKLVPRENPPSGDGAMGVALVRTALKSHPWYLAPIKGIEATAGLTIMIIKALGGAIGKAFMRKPTGVQVMGPVGVFSLFTQMTQLGAIYFLQFIAVIAVHLAIFNLLPIPAVDGGKLLFLGLEKLKGKPINPDVERKITTVFFFLLLILMALVTIRDIIKIF